MKAVFKSLIVLTVLVMMSGSVMANDIAYHVKQAPNAKGDVLIFPTYFAAPGGWETKLTVINTSGVFSTISKVIFRSHYYSQELLDFLIYLSPNDVWTGFIRHDGTNVYVYSEDDSVLVNPTTFASKTVPMRQNLFAVRCPTVISTERIATSVNPMGDSQSMGYVEVIETWYGNVSSANGWYPAPVPNTLSTVPPVSKEYLRQLYPASGAAPVANAEAGRITVPGAAVQVNSGAIDHTVNVLTGYVSIQNPLAPGMTSMMQATVLADFDNNQYLGVAAVSGIQFVTSTAVARNSLGEVEAALSKDLIALPYVNTPGTGEFSVHLFNFPTKNSDYTTAATTLLTNGECSYKNSFYPTQIAVGGFAWMGVGDTPFWTDPTAAPPAAATTKSQNAYRCLGYGSTVYDLSENFTGGGVFSGGGGANRWCAEVEMVHTLGYGAIFTEGWTSYNATYAGRTGTQANPTPVAVARNPVMISLAFSGTPIIPSALIFKSNGLDLVPGASTPGEVFAVRNPALGASNIGFAAGAFAPDFTPGNATYNYIADYQFMNAIQPSNQGVHTTAAGYPLARSAAAAVCAADIYWDNTAGANLPCLPVQIPK